MKTKHLLLLAALSLSSGMAFAQGPNERVARPSHGMYIVDGKKVMIP
jgi:hypothetical protein